MADNNKKAAKKFIVFSIIGFVMCAVSLTIVLVALNMNFPRYSEENTYEYSATFEKSWIENEKAFVSVKEYSCNLCVGENITYNKEYLSSIYSGEKNYFRLPYEIDKILNYDFDYISVVSLSANNIEVFDLDDSNAAMQRLEENIRITGYVFAAIFLIGGVECIIVYRRKKYNLKGREYTE